MDLKWIMWKIWLFKLKKIIRFELKWIVWKIWLFKLKKDNKIWMKSL